MSESPVPQPPRPDPDYRWTPPKARAFLSALAQHGKVAEAARSVGMTRQSAYKLRRRYPQIAASWALAQAAGRALRRRRGRATVSQRQGDTSGGAR